MASLWFDVEEGYNPTDIAIEVLDGSCGLM